MVKKTVELTALSIMDSRNGQNVSSFVKKIQNKQIWGMGHCNR